MTRPIAGRCSPASVVADVAGSRLGNVRAGLNHAAELVATALRARPAPSRKSKQGGRRHLGTATSGRARAGRSRCFDGLPPFRVKSEPANNDS